MPHQPMPDAHQATILVETRKPTEEAMSGNAAKAWNSTDRRQFIGGSDARIIMGQDGNASIHVHRRLKNRNCPACRGMGAGHAGPRDAIRLCGSWVRA
jgi:hypothetical protein